MPTVYYQTPVGIASITAEDGYISRVHILDEHEDYVLGGTDDEVINLAIKQLDEYFTGTRKDFDLPLKQSGSDFQQEVWQELLRIPYGQTISYAQQADRMKSPLAIRAIAAANGRNNLWLIVPCHRVIGSNGSLTGYAGGLWRKKWLLQHEARIAGVGQTMLEF